MVSWIDDGDTIEVDTQDATITVRLMAINAPDRGECLAEESLDHLIATLKGERVRLEVRGTDQFGRALAYVFDGGRNVNVEMVEAGLSLASTPEADDPHGRQILDAEENAFVSGTGLWADDACGSVGTAPSIGFDPSSSTTDPIGDDSQNLAEELLTIANHGDTTVAMGGWILRDESTRHRYRFPPGFELGARESFSIRSDDPGWDPGGSPVWNNDGDMALLQLPNGTVVDRWRY